MQVEEGDLVPLTSSDIAVNDPDTAVDRLIVVIEKQPGFGAIKDFAPSKWKAPKSSTSNRFAFVEDDF